MPTPLNRLSARGFTIAELIIVMMIIVLLVAILLPALSSARSRARRVAGQAQLASLMGACESYQIQLGAVPLILGPKDFGNNGAGGPLRATFTSNEALVVALLGGSISGTSGWTSAGTTAVTHYSNESIDVDKIGTGPASPSGKTYGAFYSPKPNELTTVTGVFATENTLPEIVDSSTGTPLAVFGRARTTGAPASFRDDQGGQFECGSMNNFTKGAALKAPGGDARDQGSNSLLSTSVSSPTEIGDNLAWVVTSKKLSSWGDGANSSSNDVAVGNLVIMNAGEDGIYLSKLQIGGASTIGSEANLELMDDFWLSGL